MRGFTFVGSFSATDFNALTFASSTIAARVLGDAAGAGAAAACAAAGAAGFACSVPIIQPAIRPKAMPATPNATESDFIRTFDHIRRPPGPRGTHRRRVQGP